MPPRSRVFPLVLLAGFLVGAGLLMVYRKSGEAAGAGVAIADLPDGSRLRLWKASFGTNHEMVLGRMPEWDGFRRKFPWAQRVLGAPTERIRGGWSGNGLCLFYSWEDEQGFPKPRPPWFSSTVDEHGCVMDLDSGRGESNLGGTNIAHQYSRLYPRRMAHFEARVGDEHGASTGSVSMSIHNPHPWVGESWVPEPVPAVREVDGLQVTYVGFQGSGRYPWPKFEVEQGGQARPEWRAGRVYFRDVTGNEAQSPKLCRHETAWEIEASFERVPESEFGPDEAWTIHTGAIPDPGVLEALEGSRTLQGMTVKLASVAGPGRYEFEKRGGGWTLLRSQPLDPEERGTGSSWGSDANRQWMNLTKSTPWVMFDLTGFTPDLTWKVVTRDTTGRWHAHSGWSGNGSSYTVEMEIPKDAVVTEVRFIAQRWRTVAFKVPPPQILTP
jgi:hypothetical protein